MVELWVHFSPNSETEHVVAISRVWEELIDCERSCCCQVKFNGVLLDEWDIFDVDARGQINGIGYEEAFPFVDGELGESRV